MYDPACGVCWNLAADLRLGSSKPCKWITEGRGQIRFCGWAPLAGGLPRASERAGTLAGAVVCRRPRVVKSNDMPISELSGLRHTAVLAGSYRLSPSGDFPGCSAGWAKGARKGGPSPGDGQLDGETFSPAATAKRPSFEPRSHRERSCHRLPTATVVPPAHQETATECPSLPRCRAVTPRPSGQSCTPDEAKPPWRNHH